MREAFGATDFSGDPLAKIIADKIAEDDQNLNQVPYII